MSREMNVEYSGGIDADGLVGTTDLYTLTEDEIYQPLVKNKINRVVIDQDSKIRLYQEESEAELSLFSEKLPLLNSTDEAEKYFAQTVLQISELDDGSYKLAHYGRLPGGCGRKPHSLHYDLVYDSGADSIQQRIQAQPMGASRAAFVNSRGPSNLYSEGACNGDGDCWMSSAAIIMPLGWPWAFDKYWCGPCFASPYSQSHPEFGYVTFCMCCCDRNSCCGNTGGYCCCTSLTDTPLMAAARSEKASLEKVKVLLEAGANPHAVNSQGKTAYDMIDDKRSPQARLLYHAMHPVEAQAEATRALEEGVNYIQSNPDYAISQFDQALSKVPPENVELKNRINAQRQIAIKERDIQGFVDSGKSFFKRDQFAQAIEAYSRALELNGAPLISALRGRARALAQSPASEQALKDCNEVLRLDPSNPNEHRWDLTYRAIAQVRCNLNLVDESTVQYLNFGITEVSGDDSKKGTYFWFIQLRGYANKQLKKYQEALKDFNMYLGFKPDEEEIIQRRDETMRAMENAPRVEFEEELNKLKTAIQRVHTAAELSALNQRFQRIELDAGRFKSADFYVVRGRFYDQNALREAGQTQQKMLKEQAVTDYRQALRLNIMAEGVGARLDVLETELRGSSPAAAGLFSNRDLPQRPTSPGSPEFSQPSGVSAEQRAMFERIQAQIRADSSRPR